MQAVLTREEMRLFWNLMERDVAVPKAAPEPGMKSGKRTSQPRALRLLFYKGRLDLMWEVRRRHSFMKEIFWLPLEYDTFLRVAAHLSSVSVCLCFIASCFCFYEESALKPKDKKTPSARNRIVTIMRYRMRLRQYEKGQAGAGAGAGAGRVENESKVERHIMCCRNMAFIVKYDGNMLRIFTLCWFT